jgi:hypothetical protein
MAALKKDQEEAKTQKEIVILNPKSLYTPE